MFCRLVYISKCIPIMQYAAFFTVSLWHEKWSRDFRIFYFAFAHIPKDVHLLMFALVCCGRPLLFAIFCTHTHSVAAAANEWIFLLQPTCRNNNPNHFQFWWHSVAFGQFGVALVPLPYSHLKVTKKNRLINYYIASGLLSSFDYV